MSEKLKSKSRKKIFFLVKEAHNTNETTRLSNQKKDIWEKTKYHLSLIEKIEAKFCFECGGSL